MKLNVSAPTYVYIINEDDFDESYALFPLPGQAVANPVTADTPIRIPGTRDQEFAWQVTSVGGHEHFLIFASPERLSALEEVFAALPRPEVGKRVTAVRIPKGALSKLRGVGGLTAAPTGKSASLSKLFTLPLGDGAETAHGMWVRQLTLENPGRGR